jgi:mannose-6-phosphate isomerase-like protein (cupin superfamily)
MLIKSVPMACISRPSTKPLSSSFCIPTKRVRTSLTSLAHAMLKPGAASLPHLLKQSSEVYFILQDIGIMHMDDEASPVGPGQAVYILPGARQHIQNAGANDLKSLCIVHPGWRKEDEVVLNL